MWQVVSWLHFWGELYVFMELAYTLSTQEAGELSEFNY
jgi:hypothetical protein